MDSWNLGDTKKRKAFLFVVTPRYCSQLHEGLLFYEDVH